MPTVDYDDSFLLPGEGPKIKPPPGPKGKKIPQDLFNFVHALNKLGLCVPCQGFVNLWMHDFQNIDGDDAIYRFEVGEEVRINNHPNLAYAPVAGKEGKIINFQYSTWNTAVYWVKLAGSNGKTIPLLGGSLESISSGE